MFWSGSSSEVLVTDETLGVGWDCYRTTRCLCWTDQGCRATRYPFSLLTRWVSAASHSSVIEASGLTCELRPCLQMDPLVSDLPMGTLSSPLE